MTSDLQEHSDERFGSQGENRRCQYTTNHGGAKTETEGFMHPFAITCTIIKTDDGLSRLRYRIIHHVNDGIEIACHTESCHAVFAQLADEDVIAHEQHHRHGQLAKHRRKTAASHVADVTHRQVKTGERELHPAQSDGLGTQEHIPEHHCRGKGATQRGGKGAAGDAHLQREHEQPVENDVEHTGNDLQRGCIFRRAVNTNHKSAYHLTDDEDAARKNEQQILLSQRHERIAASQQSQERYAEYVNDLTEKKVINGYSDGTFKPDKKVTVGEFLKLIITASVGERVNFELVTPSIDHWAGVYLKVAENVGIVGAGEYTADDMNREVSRIEIVKLLSRCDVMLVGTPQQAEELTFTDIQSLGEDDLVYLSHAVAIGVINGDSAGTFRPNDGLKRCECAKVIYTYTNR